MNVWKQRVKEVVKEVRANLKALHIEIPVDFEIGGTDLMSSYDDGVIAIPAWQAIRTVLGRKKFYHTILHEFGHAFIDQHLRLLKRRGVEALFGDLSTPYPEHTELMWHHFGRRRKRYISAYAESHPEEDVAETFAYVVKHYYVLPKVKSRKLQRKLEFMRDILVELYGDAAATAHSVAPTRSQLPPRRPHPVLSQLPKARSHVP
jgi:hypothetical protein